MFDNLVDTISGLPARVGDILGNVIDAFLDVIKDGYNAAKDFAGGLWDGFKDGLGINSPTIIEKHMFQLNDNMKSETRKLTRQTANIQKLGKKFASTNFESSIGVPSMRNLKMPAGVQDRMTVISTQRANSESARPIEVKREYNDHRQIKVENPRPERAGKSVAKVLRDASEEEGWL
jgi:hypothetical protein